VETFGDPGTALPLSGTALLPELTDEQVIARVRNGDTSPFEILMRRYNQRVFRVARAVLHDDREAEEAAQEAWLSAFAHLGSFAGRARFSTWLTRIALNEAIRRSRRRTRVAALEREMLEVTPRAGSSAEQSLLDGEIRHALESAIDRLPSAYRRTFVLREVEGLTTAEAAALLSIAEETVKTRTHRARALLRRDLGDRLGDVRDAFAFGAERCDRIVASVLARIATEP
jgi:RNA polymerase sigma-70 factor (ECF subfamily)